MGSLIPSEERLTPALSGIEVVLDHVTRVHNQQSAPWTPSERR